MTERASSSGVGQPPDHAAREHAVRAPGSVLVQAPAGSGKTTLLVQRYLRLLARVDAPERILALTFTRRAAEEMRERVLTALGAARRGQCPAAMNLETWSLALAARRRLDELKQDIERHPSRLRIETIDAFNAWLAGQLPISAGAGGAFEVLTDAQHCYQEAARRALARETNDQFGVAVDRVLALDDQRWRGLVRLIAEMLPSRERWLPLLAGRLQAASTLDEEQLRRVRQHLDEDLRLLVSRVLLRAVDVLGPERIGALSALVHGAARRMPADRRELVPWLTDGSPLRPDGTDLARWCAAVGLVLTAENKYRKQLNKTTGFPPQCADMPRLRDLIEEFERDARCRRELIAIRTLPESKYSDAQWARVREVAQVLVLAAAELEAVFREHGAVDFPAVSLAALRALGSADSPTDLSLRLDYRLQHILLDEFQDTSSAQLELVRLLTAGWQQGDERSVFCVGDPMQSIYNFRDAEVRAFLELADEGIGAVRFEVQRLAVNFRSRSSLVNWVNDCFGRILPQTDDRERGAIAYRPSEAASADPAAPGAQPGVALRGFATRADESTAIAEMIAAAAERNPGWRIAVLVRARSHARDIAAALRNRGVGFHAVEIEPLDDRSIVRDVIALTCALLHLGDRTAWLAVLRAPWAGLELADLLRIARGGPLVWSSLADEALLNELSAEGRARCRRLRSTLEAAFGVRNDSSVARWVERTWLGLGGASCAASAEGLELANAAFARLRELERVGLPDAADLPDAFSDLYADHGPPSNVEIMTIHKAKGLEFDMVVLPALDRTAPHGRHQLLAVHQFARTGRNGLVMGARPGVGDEDRLFEFLRHQQRDAAALEAERLLYVACTRAKRQLRLTAVLDGRHPSNQSRPPKSGSLLAVLWPVAAAEFAVADSDAAAQQAGPPRGGPLLRVPRDWAPPMTEASPTPTLPQTPLPRIETLVFDWAGETARRVGSLVHAELQSMTIGSIDEAMIRSRELHFRRWLALHGVPGERLPEAAARVVEALLAVLGDPRGRWILQAAREDAREQALSGRVEGAIARVIFDRSFVDEQGVRWVIDYKTSRHVGGGLQEFLDREVERYRPQLQRYALLAQKLGPEPVRLGLYFPLMRQWREWAA